MIKQQINNFTSRILYNLWFYNANTRVGSFNFNINKSNINLTYSFRSELKGLTANHFFFYFMPLKNLVNCLKHARGYLLQKTVCQCQRLNKYI